jgi:D-alanine-D-alanine ligase
MGKSVFFWEGRSHGLIELGCCQGIQDRAGGEASAGVCRKGLRRSRWRIRPRSTTGEPLRRAVVSARFPPPLSADARQWRLFASPVASFADPRHTSFSMKIGITYDLRQEYLAIGYSEEQTAEFDRPDTIDAIENSLHRLGHETVRIGNVRKLVSQLAQGAHWDLVFNFTEGMFGFGREAQVPALLEAWEIPYTFSDPLVLSLTLHKGMCKHVLRDQGLPTADFEVIDRPEDFDRVQLAFPLFAKPVAEGTGKGVSATSRITTRDQLRAVGGSLLERFHQPVLLETWLPGREFTVGILGTGTRARSLGVLEVILRPNAEAHAYSYINKQQYEELVHYELVDDAMARQASDLALRAHRAIGCRDSSRIDLRADERNELAILEINPVAGLHPQHSDLPILCTAVGIGYDELIGEIIRSARERVPQTATE